MQENTRYNFGKSEKLKSRKDIDELFKNGQSFSIFPFRVTYLFVPVKNFEVNNIKVAVSVSKRHFKKATDRNRIKRLMREAYRLQKNGVLKISKEKSINFNVFIIYIGNELPNYKLVFSKLGNIINKVQKLFDDKI